MILNNIYALGNDGSRFDAIITRDKNTVTALIPKRLFTSAPDFVDIVASEFTACIGENGYFMSANCNRYGYLCYFTDRPDADRIDDEIVIPIYGVKKDDFCILAIPEGMKYDMQMVLTLKDGKYFLRHRIVLDKDAPYEDITIIYHILAKDADYCDMAKDYRRYQLENGRARLIRDKILDRPILAYAKDAPEIRIRMGWKPAPSPVPEQTEENEPQMHVACTFDRVRDLIDELKKRGVKKAEICLVGWNKSGHDGRWPSIFPVEPLLGGEERLKSLIEYAKKNGYLIVCHTNSTDAYSISPYFNGNLLEDKNGKHMSAGVWSGGKGRRLCPKKAYEIASKLLPKVAELGFSGLHYIDVLAVISPMKCSNPAHPVNRRETVAYYEKIMALCHKLFGGFASEGAYDFASKYVDYGFYIAGGGVPSPFFDVRIPIWQIVYHGIILSNASTGTVNNCIKENEQRLYAEECGSRLSFYIYQKFLSSAHADWLGKNDMTLDGDELYKTADMISEGYKHYCSVSHLQTELIDRYDIVSDKVTAVKYENGVTLVVNRNDTSFDYNCHTVPPKDYIYIE